MDPNSSTEEGKMGVFLNDDVLKLARQRIQNEEPEEAIEMKLSNENGIFVVSRNKEELMALEKITYNGVTYYVGVPK